MAHLVPQVVGSNNLGTQASCWIQVDLFILRWPINKNNVSTRSNEWMHQNLPQLLQCWQPNSSNCTVITYMEGRPLFHEGTLSTLNLRISIFFRNFERPFTPRGWLRSASNFVKTRFGRSPTFHFSTAKTSKKIDFLQNFERPFTPRGWLRSASNFGKTRFRRSPTFHFSTLKKIV